MKFRFEVVEEGTGQDRYFWIRDNEAKRWNMPDHATTLNFGKRETVEKVCELLNNEWYRFLRNPN